MFLKIFIFGLICSTAVECAKILAVFPVTLTGDSMGYHLMNELTARNHDVTVLNLFSVEEYNGCIHQKNYTEVVMDNTWKVFIDLIDDDYSKNYHEGIFSSVTYAYDKAYQLTEELLSDNNFQNFLSESKNKFDILIMEYYLNDALLGIGKFLGIPTVLLSSTPSAFHVNHIFVNPAPTAFIPVPLTGYTRFMNYWERMDNLFYNSFQSMYRRFVMFSKHEKLLKKYIDPNMNLNDAVNNVDLLLTNSHPVVTEPVPHMPNMIEIGGYHIKEKPIPEAIQITMDKAFQGVIIVSLRFNFGISQGDRSALETLAKAFENVEQQVIWHLDNGIHIQVQKSLEMYQPLNQSILKETASVINFFPLYDNVGFCTYEEIQHGLLDHPNTVAVVTQGDLNDIMAAVYFGVPIIGVPVNREQKANVAAAVSRGYALSFSYEQITELDILSAVTSIVEPQYVFNVKEASSYLREQIAKPMNVAMHWIEFVIKHQGSKNLKSPGILLSYIQKSSIDVLIFLVIIDIILFMIFYYIFKHIIHCLVKNVKKIKRSRSKKYIILLNE